MGHRPNPLHQHRYRHPLNRIYGVGLLLLAVVLIAMVGYRIAAGWSWFDSFYTTIFVLSTNGYTGELGPLDHVTKVLTICLIVVGGALFVFSVTQITSVLADEETRHYFALQSKLRKVKHMENHMIVCGLGRVGRAVSQEFQAVGQPFLIVERDPARLELAAANGWPTMPGDATEDRSLEMAGIAKARGLVACVESDASNLFIVVSARGLKSELEIFARVSEEANISKFKRAGANHVYSPYALLGRTIARNVAQPRVQQILDLAQEHGYADLTMEERTVSEGSPAVEKTIRELDIRGRFDAVVFAIVDANQKLIHNPGPDTRIQAGDFLILLGAPEQLRRLSEELKLT